MIVISDTTPLISLIKINHLELIGDLFGEIQIPDAVYRELDFFHTTKELFCEIMLNHKQYNLPSFESITRCRRKLQNDYPELANEKTKEKRLNETAEYIDYAIGGYKNTFSRLVESYE